MSSTYSVPRPGARRPRWYKKRRLSIVIAGVLLLLILIPAIVFIATTPDTNKPLPVANKSTITPAGQVAVTATGFAPETIIIKKGQSVSWMNTDSQPHQVASDPYPAEDGLAGFVEQSPMLANDDYTFVFSERGSFTYHDHINPLTFRGTVIVK